jgi:hypothetical protein
MSVAIKLPDSLVKEAKRYANIYRRSIPKQIEYWSSIGKIIEENQDLPYRFIKDIMIAQDEVKNKELEEYKFGQDE